MKSRVDRPDLEGVAPPRRLQRADGLVLLALLAHLRFAIELNVGFGRAEPDVGADRHPEVVDPKRVEEAVLEPGAEILASRMSVLSTRSAMVGSSRSITRLFTRSAKYSTPRFAVRLPVSVAPKIGPRSPEVPGAGETQEVAHVDRQELRGPEVEEEERPRQILQPDRPADGERRRRRS